MALVDAAHQQEFGQVRDLVTQFTSDPKGSLEMFVAEQQEEFQQLFKDWKQERSVNQRDPFGDTPLHAAAAQGNLLLVRYLVSEGADVNATNFVRRNIRFLAGLVRLCSLNFPLRRDTPIFCFVGCCMLFCLQHAFLSVNM